MKEQLHSNTGLCSVQRLFKYISGENEQNTRIDMTSPVKTYVQAGQGPYCKSTFTVSFYVPSEFQVGNHH